MKIAIEGQRLFRKKKHGMDMVALELIRNLQLIDRENEYVIFVQPDEDDQVIQETPNFKIVKLDGGFYPLWEQIALPKAAASEGCDILHCTSNTAPIFSSIPIVDTLHDIIYMEHSYLKILQGSGTPYQKFGNVSFRKKPDCRFFRDERQSSLNGCLQRSRRTFQTSYRSGRTYPGERKISPSGSFLFLSGEYRPEKKYKRHPESICRFCEANQQ